MPQEEESKEGDPGDPGDPVDPEIQEVQKIPRGSFDISHRFIPLPISFIPEIKTEVAGALQIQRATGKSLSSVE